MFSWRSSKGILFIAASALWAGGAAMAQQPGGSPGGMQPPPSSQQQVPGEPGAPGTPSTGLPDQNQASQQSFGDQMFVRETLEGDDAQVQMSQLAQQKSSSDDVKQFGQKMVQVHTALNTQLAAAAKQLGVSEPKRPSKKEKKELDRLQALSGPDFDTAYIQAMAKQQQHDLKEFKSEAESGQNPDIQQAARQDEPVLSQHYQVLQKLAQTHNVTLESQK